MIFLASALASFDALEQDIEAGHYGKIVAVVVEQHGRIIYQYRFRDGSHRRTGSADPELHDIRSAGKSITALAVGLAVGDGKLTLEQQVLPGISVEDLLTMNSSLACDDGKRSSPGNEQRMYKRKRWGAFVMQLPRRQETGFSYCTAGVFFLGQVVQEAVGERFDKFVQRRLFDPLGIHEVHWRTSRTGEIQSGGQLEIGAEDLTKLGRLVLDGGRWKDEQLLAESWVRDMLTARHQNGLGGYGLLWWRRPVQTEQGWLGSWSMQGNGGNIVAVLSGPDVVVTVLSANYNQKGSHDRSFAVISRAVRATEKKSP